MSEIDLANESPQARCHLLPCHIAHDGPAAVDTYFVVTEKPSAAGADSTTPTPVASFRGRRLMGNHIALPEGYRGFILAPSHNDSEEYGGDEGSSTRKWTHRAQFSSLHCWGHDEVPSVFTDPLVNALDWCRLMQTLHKPVTPAAFESWTDAQPSLSTAAATATTAQR
ncbi:hypothetical protein RI367_000392 [Sorochytrium milnesiophthora]